VIITTNLSPLWGIKKYISNRMMMPQRGKRFVVVFLAFDCPRGVKQLYANQFHGPPFAVRCKLKWGIYHPTSPLPLPVPTIPSPKNKIFHKHLLPKSLL
jgi:hypothetical protein